jgi:hypothetical protein
MNRRVLFFAANLAVVSLAVLHLWDSYNVNRFAGVGGPDEFRKQKIEQLERMRTKLDHLPEDVREREEAAIVEQIRELETGAKVEELGEELRRVK